MVRFLIELIKDHMEKLRKERELQQKVRSYRAPVMGSQLNKWKETR